MAERSRLVRIVSGGQTGVDRAALDTAMAFGLACGGWVPRGRRAEDGEVPHHYPMRETRSYAYAERTRRNVRDSDGTLILAAGKPTGGTALTAAFARQLGKPCLLIDLKAVPDPVAISDWLGRYSIRVLNVAGPRESTCPGIHGQAKALLSALLRAGRVFERISLLSRRPCHLQARTSIDACAVCVYPVARTCAPIGICDNPTLELVGLTAGVPSTAPNEQSRATIFVERQGGETPHD